jgi:HEAT repeat protein
LFKSAFSKPRIAKFVMLAILLACGNTYGSTLAAAQFLNVAGSEGLPLYYLLFAAISIPVSLKLAHAIDRYPHHKVLLVLIVATAAVGTTAAVLAAGDREGTVFAIYLGISVLEQLSYSIFFVLLADHLTVLEINRHTALMSMAMAAGGLLGGALVWAGTRAATASILLHGLAPLLGLAAVQAVWIARSEQPPDPAEPAEAGEGLAESLQSLPRIIARYPIALLIASSVFLNQVTQCVIEFQAFAVYAETFPEEQALGGFLGLMNVGLNLVGVALSLGFTKPMIGRLGVGRMNLVFPGAMLLAFAWLSVDLALPAAIFGHIVYDALAHSIDAPVFTANYNALGHRFVGRVRVFCDGIIYPVALAASGAMLMVARQVLDPLGVSLLGAVLAIAFVAVGWGIGRLYVRGMLDLVREGAVPLGTAAAGLGTLPARYADDILALLRSGDRPAQMLALELAVRMDLGRFLGEVQQILPLVDVAVRRLLAERLRGRSDAGSLTFVRQLATADAPSARALALEVLLSVEGGLSRDDLASFLTDPADEVAAIAAVGWTLMTGDRSALDRHMAGSREIRLAMVHAIGASRDATVSSLMAIFVDDPDPVIRAVALDAAAGGEVRRPLAAGWARHSLGDPDPEVRAAAVRLLGKFGDPADTRSIAAHLGDAAEPVRAAAADVLAEGGPHALDAAEIALATAIGPTLDAAIAAVGRVGGRDAERRLVVRLEVVVHRPIARNRVWREALPDLPRFAALRLALDDSDRRSTDLVLHAIGALGHLGTVRLVRAALATGDERTRANAIEALTALAHRRLPLERLLLPLLPILDPEIVAPGRLRGPREENILAGAAADLDPWLRRGAAFACGEAEGEIMSRLLFLRTVPLFAGMSLDDLVAVDEALTYEEYLASEVVITEGEVGDRLYLIQRGEARVTAAGREVAHIGPSEYFGEMAMFDYKPRSASVIAIRDCSMLTLKRDRFRSLVAQRPNVLMHICRVFGERLRAMNQRLASG